MRKDFLAKFPPPGEVRKLVEGGFSDRMIAKQVKVNPLTVRSFRRIHNIPSMSEIREQKYSSISAPFEFVWPPSRDQMQWLVDQQMSDKKIASFYGMSHHAVFQRRWGYRIESAIPGHPSHYVSAPPQFKMSDEALAKMYAGQRYESVDKLTLLAESGDPDFRRDYRSRVVPRNFAEMNDPAYRHLVTA